MGSSPSGLRATVTLRDVDQRDPVPVRSIVLQGPKWQIKIGRGSLNGPEDIYPATENAWFDSRVVSRDHAILRADPNTQEILIEDVGSMHGTHLSGRRLKTKHVETLYPKDILTMGADVTRGSSYFKALRVMVTWSWSEESTPSSIPAQPTFGNAYANTFSADYSDEEHADDISSHVSGQDDEDDGLYESDADDLQPNDEEQIVPESLREPSIEMVVPPRTFTVPESDLSDTGSVASGEHSEEADLDESSPISSPVFEGDVIEDKIGGASSIMKPDPVLDSPSLRQTASTQATTTRSESKTPITVDLTTSLADDLELDYQSYGQLDEEGPLGPQAATTDPPASTETHIQTAWTDPLDAPVPAVYDPPFFEKIRTPSPSDAALAKPCMEPTSAPPFVPYLGTACLPATNLSSQGRSTSAWAGHNSVLYDPLPHGAVGHTLPTHLYRPAQPQCFRTQWGAAPIANFSLTPETTSRVSIANIVDQAPGEKSLLPKASSRLKRKADEISSGPTPDVNVAHADVLSPELDLAAASLNDVINNSHKDGLQQPSTQAAELNAVDSAEDKDGPPRKKAKNTKPRTGRNGRTGSGGFVKMAAATIAGVAIGAVGTVIGLAALPQDYFM